MLVVGTCSAAALSLQRAVHTSSNSTSATQSLGQQGWRRTGPEQGAPVAPRAPAAPVAPLGPVAPAGVRGGGAGSLHGQVRCCVMLRIPGSGCAQLQDALHWCCLFGALGHVSGSSGQQGLTLEATHALGPCSGSGEQAGEGCQVVLWWEHEMPWEQPSRTLQATVPGTVCLLAVHAIHRPKLAGPAAGMHRSGTARGQAGCTLHGLASHLWGLRREKAGDRGRA